jgi:hypothetical protein
MLTKLAALLAMIALGSGVTYAESGNEFVISESRGATGGRDYTVRNNREVALTGFTIKAIAHPATGSAVGTIIFDAFMSGQAALKFGESYTWHFANDSSYARPTDYSVDAAIFADGVAVGDPAAIKSLWTRRHWTVVGLQEVFHDVDTAVPNLDDTESAIAILKQLQAARVPPGTPREERDSVRDAYGTVIEGLRMTADLRAKGKLQFTGSDTVAGMRRHSNDRIKAIQSQIAPAQVNQ